MNPARSATAASGALVIPAKPDGTLNYDLVIPVMLGHYFPNGLLGLGLTALLASFMSGMAGNVTAFNTVWTNDIYRPYINPRASDAHLLWMGRASTIVGILLSLAAAAIHQGLTLPAHAVAGLKGGWLGIVHWYPSEMAQNFWTAIFAWTTCLCVTIAVSLATDAAERADLPGLVYGETARASSASEPWYQRPVPLGLLALLGAAVLNFVFW